MMDIVTLGVFKRKNEDFTLINHSKNYSIGFLIKLEFLLKLELVLKKKFLLNVKL